MAVFGAHDYAGGLLKSPVICGWYHKPKSAYPYYDLNTKSRYVSAADISAVEADRLAAVVTAATAVAVAAVSIA